MERRQKNRKRGYVRVCIGLIIHNTQKVLRFGIFKMNRVQSMCKWISSMLIIDIDEVLQRDLGRVSCIVHKKQSIPDTLPDSLAASDYRRER